MQDDHPTVENELNTIFDKFNGEGAHACYCQRSVDGGCQCAIKDEYATEAKESIKALIASEVRRARIDELSNVYIYHPRQAQGTLKTDHGGITVEERLKHLASLKDTHTGEE
jgi:hypothetical protein